MKTQNIITVKPQGYCGGVLKAIEVAKKTRIQYPDQKITILGNLVPLIQLKTRIKHVTNYWMKLMKVL